MKTLHTHPDTIPSGPGSELRVAGPAWIENVAKQVEPLLAAPPEILTIDMVGSNFATLFDWITFTSIMERLLSSPMVNSIGFDFASDKDHVLLSRKEWFQYRNGTANKRMVRKQDFDYSTRLYEIIGYLESLGTSQVLNRPRRIGKVFYPQFAAEALNFKAFYTRDDRETRVLNLNRVESKEDCKQFLDESRILNWKNEMHRRFRHSPIFEFEEVWRVFFHELAVNIWEHAQVPGFMAGRVVFPLLKDGKPKPWCIRTYAPPIQERFKEMATGFLELCASDYGRGLTETLKAAFLRHTGKGTEHAVSPEELLAFAFDEFGTCKNANDSWATERHALGRILLLVAKYGGVLVARSGGAELTYVSQGGEFTRLPNHLGYKPQFARRTTSALLGTQLQLILPLIPLVKENDTPRQRWMSMQLPDSFHVNSRHVRGHLVPLLEEMDLIPAARSDVGTKWDFSQAAIGAPERKLFRAACEKLCRKLMKWRPSEEPLVFDFTGFRWSTAQFETLLHLLQNVLQTRPVLLVELDPKLALEIEKLEHLGSPTELDSETIVSSPGFAGKAFSEPSESRFMDTFRRVHSTLLAIDREQRPYFFGLPHVQGNLQDYSDALLSLINKPHSIDDLTKAHSLNKSTVSAILNNINPLFQSHAGQWHCVWNATAISNEANRVMSLHFDHVMSVCEARWGKPHPRKRTAGKRQLTLSLSNEDRHLSRFGLPWQEDTEWAQEFIECSRILSRGRYADEAAQRLVYRLRKGLEARGHSLRDVHVLACVTAPSLLLAAAMHRWWPDDQGLERPTIADMGYYLMLHPDQHPPLIPGHGGVVIVQDLLSTGVMSGRLIQLLKSQEKSILALIAMVRFVANLKSTRATHVMDWTEGHQDEVPRHAMIEIKRPAACPPPADYEDDSNAYWVEPRTLRPIPFRHLRGDAGSVSSGEPPILLRSQLYEGDNTCLVRAGHYVYGSRHYSIAIDVQRALRGNLGDTLASWIADLCEGAKDRPKALWETDRGYQDFKGDVSAVLLPLHSQIHYLWPKVENLLAQRGRRQHMWLLDATLFLGRGPAYRLPKQFEEQVQIFTEELAHRSKGQQPARKLRILVLDDAIATSRTALTILDTIKRAVKECIAGLKTPVQLDTSPIEWVRYFAVFNQIGFAHTRHWHDLESLRLNFAIPFILEEYAQCMGFTTYEDGLCPNCRDLERITHVRSLADQFGMEEARRWAHKRMQELQPIAIDSTDFATRLSNPVPTQIRVLNQTSLSTELAQLYQTHHADAAIGIFHELMYRSYPPNDLLISLAKAFAPREEPASEGEYARYRWAVLEWCIRNWSRIEACGARREFCDAVALEVNRNSENVERIFEAAAHLYTDDRIIQLLLRAVDLLCALEKARGAEDKTGVAGDRRMRIYRGLSLFMLNLGEDTLKTLKVRPARRGRALTMLDYIGSKAKAMPAGRSTFVRQLYIRFTRPQRFPNPGWALSTISEALFRGDTARPAAARHQLLPLLLKHVNESPQNEERRQLLRGSLSLFLAALDDLTPYLYGETLTDKDNIVHNGKTLLDWLRLSGDNSGAKQKPSALTYLRDYLAPNKPFCTSINSLYHKRVSEIGEACNKHMEDLGQELKLRLSFLFDGSTDAKESRVLTQAEHLCLALCNWTIDPIKDFEGRHKSVIYADIKRQSAGADQICFRLATSFAGPDETNERVKHGRGASVDRATLELFGIEIGEWVSPPKAESDLGLKSTCEILAPAGFIRKGEICT